MKRNLALLWFLIAAMSVASLWADTNVAEGIQSRFRLNVLTLRGLYRGDHLEFSADGRLLNHSDISFGPADALFTLEKVEQKHGKLILTGSLPVIYYSGGKATFAIGALKREVEIALPEATMAAALESFFKVFFKADEQAAAPCAPENDALARVEQKNLPPANEPCLLTGERGFGVEGAKTGGKFTPPRAIYDPMPELPPHARGKKLDGKDVLSIVVDQQGRASAIMVVKSLGNGFDEMAAATVHTWRFEPAKRDGEPVAMRVNIEINFHVYE